MPSISPSISNDISLNPFELVFDQASSDPSKEAEFYNWLKKQEFFVPCQQVLLGANELPQVERRIQVTPTTRIRLKAFQQDGGLIVPFFSHLSRFEQWSTPDPKGQYVVLAGTQVLAMVPPGASALLNPGSERFSKWFTSEEIRGLSL